MKIQNIKSMLCVAALLFLFSCTSKPSIEQRLASKDASVVRAALTDMWRTGEIQNITAAVSLLDKKEFYEDAAFALSLLNSEAVDKVVLNGLNVEREIIGRLFYLYLVSKNRNVFKETGKLDYRELEDPSWSLVHMIAARGEHFESALIKAWMLLDDGDAMKYQSIVRQYLVLVGEKGGMNFYNSLRDYIEKCPEFKVFALWAMHRLKSVNKIRNDRADRVITSNPYWKKHGKDPVMPGVPGTFKAWHTANPDILVENDMVYFYYRGGDGHDRMAVATSPLETFDGLKFVDYPNNPIINLGKNSFDDLAVLDPGTIFFNKQVFLYYSGLGTGDDAVGLATSKDFYNFKKYKNPVLTGRAPEVLIKDGIIYMYYVKPNGYGGYSIYLATSDDGYNFISFGSEPVFAPGKAGEWDSRSVTVPRIREKDGVYYMFYAGDDKYMDYPAYFGIAFSYDLVNWYRGTQNPIFSRGKKGDWDDGGIWYAEVFPFKNKLYMYYEGWGGAESHSQEYGAGGRSQIGLAVSDYSLEDML